jgi:hypothetical protein
MDRTVYFLGENTFLVTLGCISLSLLRHSLLDRTFDSFRFSTRISFIILLTFCADNFSPS